MQYINTKKGKDLKLRIICFYFMKSASSDKICFVEPLYQNWTPYETLMSKTQMSTVKFDNKFKLCDACGLVVVVVYWGDGVCLGVKSFIQVEVVWNAL